MNRTPKHAPPAMLNYPNKLYFWITPRNIFWFCVMFCPAVFSLFYTFYPWTHTLYAAELNRIATFILPVFLIEPFGIAWMLYQAIRYEQRPLPFALLALFVPLSFLWYYFERVRTGKQTRRELPRTRNVASGARRLT